MAGEHLGDCIDHSGGPVMPGVVNRGGQEVGGLRASRWLGPVSPVKS